MKCSSGIWICPSCGLPSFSSSLFDSSGTTSTENSFSILSDVDIAVPTGSDTPSSATNSYNKKRLNSGKLKVVSININSLRGKSLQMLELIHTEQPDVILCQETKLDKTVSSAEVFPESYVTFRKDRNLNGGGVCIALKKQLQATECHDLDSDLEAIWIQIQTSNHRPIYLCSLYRPPDKDSDYIEQLRKPLDILSNRHRNRLPEIVIAGDLNYACIDWLTCSATCVSSGGNFVDILNDHHLQQIVDNPTRYGKSSSSLLDLVICTQPSMVHNLSVGREISDHCMVSFDLSLQVVLPESTPRKILLYSRGNYNQLRSDMHTFGSSFIASSPDLNTVNDNWLNFKHTITSSVNKNVPSKLVTDFNRRPSWLSPKVRKAIRKRDRLSTKARKSHSIIDRDRYRKARNLATSEIQREYQSQLNALIGNVNADPRSFYRFIKSKKADPIGISSLKSGNDVITGDKEKADCLNRYFSSIFTIENDDVIANAAPSYPDMPDIEVAVQGVLKLLSTIDTKKACGPDELSPRVLKETCQEIAPVLTFIFNQSLLTGKVPDDWLMANIFALHKKGPKELPENYRPISLTSICSKIMEHIVCSSTCKFLEENKILTPRQHGFRPGHSCESQLILAIDDWASALNSGLRTDVAIFDFSKAFDSVPHRRLLSKIESYGIRGTTLAWIRSFLSNRVQRVVINGSQSSWLPVISGVPQGTVLGPLLFLLYINDITTNIQSEIRLFADDCILYRTIQSDADVVTLQDDINTMLAWSHTWQMSFNAAKCHILSICRQHKKPLLQYKLGPDQLSNVDSYPYLGVTISADLRWHHHVDDVCFRASRTLNFLRRNIYRCSPEAKALAYTSLVRPHLEYASAAWDPYTAIDINKLEMVQRRAARFAKSDYRHTSSVTGFLNELDWDQLSLRRKHARLTTLYKAIHSLTAIPTGKLLRPTRFSRSSNEHSFIGLSSRIDTYKYSFFPRTIIDWNVLPEAVQSKTSVDSFRYALCSKPGLPPDA